MKLALAIMLLALGCGGPAPVGRSMEVTAGDDDAIALVSVVDATSAAPVPDQFADLTCLPGEALGYRLVFRVRVGAPGTTVRLRINRDDSIDYRSQRLDLTGSTSTAASTRDDAIVLHGGVLGAYWFVDGVVDIPNVAPSVEGLAVFWSAAVTESSASDVSEVLVSSSQGAAKWTVRNAVDALSLLATTGATEEGTFVGGEAALYRWLR